MSKKENDLPPPRLLWLLLERGESCVPAKTWNGLMGDAGGTTVPAPRDANGDAMIIASPPPLALPAGVGLAAAAAADAEQGFPWGPGIRPWSAQAALPPLSAPGGPPSTAAAATPAPPRLAFAE